MPRSQLYYGCEKKFLIGHGFHEGTHIIDANTTEILQTVENVESKIQSYPFYSKSDIAPKTR